MEEQENLDNKEETLKNNLQEEITENKEMEEKAEDDKTEKEDSMEFKKMEPTKK